MDIKGLEQLIDDVAAQNDIDKNAIVDDLADILKMKYGISIMAKERELIDEVKMRVITKLYNKDMQKIPAKSDLSKVFQLDLLQLDYLDTAMTELEHEGLMKQDKADISLSKEGVMKFKEFYDEI